jgi:hypothetical protein
VIDTATTPAQIRTDLGAGGNADVIAPDDQKPGDRRLFTWEQPEHANCKHELGAVVAIKADGTKLAFCRQCNLLALVKPAGA